MLQRVSNPMMQQMMLTDMQNNLARMLEIQHQIATQKKFSKPSDNPIDVTRSLAMGTTITENVQYQRNIDDGVTWLKNTETSFNQITNVYQQVRQLAIYAGDGGLADVDMGAIAEQLEQLQEEMRCAANYEVEGRFLLSGLSTGIRPFVRDASGKVIYQGSLDSVQFEMERQELGKVSFNGRDIFPANDTQYTLRSVEVGMDFLWKGRDEILQLQVGDQMVKARLPEKWQDEKLDNIDDPTDFNRYRDPGEQEGYTLDDIAKAINDSMEMGNVKRLVSVTVEKDETRGVQRLVVKSHNGQPVRLTTWPETDQQKLAQGIGGTHVPAGFVADADSTMTVDFLNGVTYDVKVAAGDTLADIAAKLRSVPGIWASDNADGANQWLEVVARAPGTPYQIKLTGNVRNLFGSVDTVSSNPVDKNTDHSHIDLGRLLGIETALKSTELVPTWNVNTTAANGALHWKFQSGDRKGEIFINSDPNLTLQELATQITAVMGDWVEAVVETDAPDGTKPTPDPLGNSGANFEAATQRLVLRTKDGAPLVVYDGEKAGAAVSYARQMGVETALRGAGTVTYPSDGAGAFDENMPALMNVQVGDRSFTVKVCRKADTAELVLGAIASQVNEQAGTKLLDVDALTGGPGGSVALLSLTGEPVRIVDRGYGDPAYAAFTGGVAQQLGIQAGVRSTVAVGSDQAGATGTLRIQTQGRSVDVSVLATDTLQSLSDRIRGLTGDWLDVSYFDQTVQTPPGGGEVRLALAAKDGSPLSIYDVSGGAADTFRLRTALRSNVNVSGWTAAAGDQLTLSVNGVTQTIDLFDENATPPPPPPASVAANIDELAALINSRFQAQDLRAQVVDAGAGDRRLVLSSPRGYQVTVEAAGTTLANPIGIAPGITSPNRGGEGPFNQQVQVRTAANQKGQDFFGVLDDLIAAVKGEDRLGISNFLLGKVTAWGDNLLKCRTECGALVNRYENSESRLKENNLNLTELQSKISDVDLAEAATQFQMAQAVYQASLAVISKIVQPTLVDFLR
ncbi:flagellin domain protein [Aminomonas paucivorans DSM 12260]|uniref:Flagellin domain protein n=1 Tax=Aminomonas paucivorans DSM 12260 TaxID=584708 RepID=E3CXD2_9BACT|nr:flagellar hook-associated protein FlgL [Aminomonas paucivorans]EFQ23498.1 flagellin domain protein [Aminomonas paucivorans DSM 12260]